MSETYKCPQCGKEFNHSDFSAGVEHVIEHLYEEISKLKAAIEVGR